MIQKRAANERGHVDHGWLNTYHTFSFADYYDPEAMGFRTLRVINEDFVAPGKGFGSHPHRDMEIITYILEGALEHKDSMGNGSVIRPGDVQYMSAGTGVFHSEFNPSPTESVHLLQIWIVPSRRGLTPSYGQQHFSRQEKLDGLKLVASHDGDQGSVKIEQDAKLYASILGETKSISYPFENGRYGWLQLTKGSVEVNGTTLESGDGLAIAEEPSITISGKAEESEFLLFDLP